MMPSAYFIRDGKTNPWTEGGGTSMYPPFFIQDFVRKGLILSDLLV